MRYAVNPDDTFGAGRSFIAMTSDEAPGRPDGMKVDQTGNLYSPGPGGVWLMAADGRRLGAILASEFPAKLVFRDADNNALYLAERTSLSRIRLKISGIPAPGSN